MDRDIALAMFSAVVGAGLSHGIHIAVEKYRFRQELKSNNSIDVSGDDWHAAWQTSVDGAEILNTEKLSIKQKGSTIKISNKEKSPENPKGGYLWEAQVSFFHGRDVMGWYFPKKSENISSKGIMFLNYNSSRRLFIGKWVGCAYDGPLSNGYVVISKERTASLERLKEILKNHPSEVQIISQVI